jgi:protein SCO1
MTKRHRGCSARSGAMILLALLLLIGTAPLPHSAGRAETAGATVEPAAPIALVDHTGRAITTQEFLGKPSLVFFGFTNCPSICPTMLSDVSRRMADIGPLADAMNFIFVSVDPEHDTPDILRDYLGFFDKRIIGLTGGQSEIAALAKALGAHFAKVPQEGGGYTFDHSVMAFLMDRDWRRKGLLVLGPGTDEKRASDKLRALLAQAGH